MGGQVGRLGLTGRTAEFTSRGPRTQRGLPHSRVVFFAPTAEGGAVEPERMFSRLGEARATAPESSRWQEASATRSAADRRG